MADHALRQADIRQADIQCHRTSRWLRRYPLFLALLAVIAVLLPTGTALAAPIQTGDPVADSVLPQEEDTSKRPEVEAAIEKLKKQDVKGALESLEAASEKYPDQPPARVFLAQVFLRSGGANSLKAAHAQLDQAVVDHPQDPAAYLMLGGLAIRSQLMTEAALLLGKGTELIASFEGDEIRLKRFRLLSSSGLAQLAEMRQEWETAEQHLREMITVEEGGYRTHQRLGVALFMLGSSDNREEAYTEFKRAAELSETAHRAEVAMGQLYAADDKDNSAKKAMEWYSYAVDQHPEHVATRIQMAQHLVNIGDPEAALTHAQQAEQLDPESKEARLALGQVNRYLGNHEAAQALFEAVHNEAPTYFPAINWLTLSLADQDDPAKHQRAFELINDIVLKGMPNNDSNRPEAFATAGWVYHRLGQADKAEQALTAAVNSRRVGQDARYHLALVLLKKGDTAEAKIHLEMVLKDKSTFIYRREAKKLLAELQ